MKKNNKKHLASNHLPNERSAETEWIVQLLDSEIQSVNERNQKFGWSKWVLFGSLATLLWLFLTEYENTVSLEYFFELFVLFVTGGIYIISFIAILQFSYTTFDGKSKFIMGNVLFEKRPAIFFLFSMFLAIIFIFRSSDTYTPFSKTSSLIFYGFLCIISLIGLYLNFRNLPLPKRLEENIFFSIFVSLVFLLSSISFSSQSFGLKLNDSLIDSIKLSGIAFCIVVVILLILSYPTTPPFVR